MKKELLLSVAVLAAAASTSSAVIIGFGQSAASYNPAVVPTYEVLPGGTLNAFVFISAQGAGRVQTVSFGIREANAATAPTTADVGSASWPSFDWLSSPVVTPGEAHTGGFVNPGAGVAGTGASIITSFGGSTVAGTPSNPITTTPRLLLSLTGTVPVEPGTYYLYLHRTGSNITETPSFTEVSAVDFPGLSATALSSSVRFGNSGPIPSGSGTAANFGQRSSGAADAIIIVSGGTAAPTVTLTPGGADAAIVPGNGTGYLPTLANAGVFAFAGSNTGATIVAFDLNGADGVPDGLVLPTGASIVPLTGLFADNLGGSFDFVVDFGNLGSGPFTAAIDGLGTGVSVARIAAIPEPAALGLLAPIALMAARRRKA